MSDPYISEFCACIRHPEHEAGEESTYHVSITKWDPDALGVMKPRAVTVTAEAAEAAGFSLDKVIGEMTAALVRERDEARKEATDKALELEKAAAARDAAAEQATQAIKVAETYQTLGAQAIAESQALKAREAALLAQIEELTDTEAPDLWTRIKAVFAP